MDYYYSLNNQPEGPVPLDRLHELFRTGVISAATLVVPVGGSEWKPYSTLEAAPQDLAGSAVPRDVPPADAGASSSETSAQLPPPTPPSAARAGTPSYAAPAGPETAQPPYKNLVLISWVLFGATALLSIIPILGCFSWLMLIPVVITCVILGVITLQRGGTTQGVLILIAAVVVLPLITIIAPIVTTALFGAVTGLGDENKKRSSPAPEIADASPSPAVVSTTPATTRSPGAGPSPAKPAIAQAVEDPAQLFTKLDITQNGYLSGTEMKDYQGYDTNKDDQVSKEEFMAGSARDTRLKAIAATLDQFLIMLNNGQYDQSFDAASESFRSGVTKAAWTNNLRKNREPLGKAADHQLKTIDTNTDLTSGRKTYVVPVASKFEKGSATETITVVQDADNQYRVSDYSMTTEFSAPQPAVATKGGAANTNDTPPPAAAKQMVNNTMINFKNAVNSGDFDTFYRTQLSDLWKKEITAQKLRTSFKPFVDRKVDLTPIFAVEPVLDEPPYVDGNGLLTLVGHYPVASEKVKVTFDLSYSREAKWALSGIKVNIKGINE